MTKRDRIQVVLASVEEILFHTSRHAWLARAVIVVEEIAVDLAALAAALAMASFHLGKLVALPLVTAWQVGKQAYDNPEVAIKCLQAVQKKRREDEARRKAVVCTCK